MIKLDGTDNKSKFGANAILGISLAACRAGWYFIGCKKHVVFYQLVYYDSTQVDKTPHAFCMYEKAGDLRIQSRSNIRYFGENMVYAPCILVY